MGLGLIAAKGEQAHGFDAAGDDDAVAAGADAQIGHGDGFKAGGAEAVDGDAGNFDGKAGAQSGQAGDVPALLALWLGAAEDDVVDFGFVERRNPVQSSAQWQLRRGRRGGWWRARLWGRGQRACERR